MKRLIIFALLAIGLAACKTKDVPVVSFNKDTYVVSRDGGELIIPVNTTGIDNVTVTHDNGDRWDIDPETGDMTPAEGWIKLVKVINNYETRALPQWTSGIQLYIEDNNSNYERSAEITVYSFTKQAKVTVRQGF